MNSRLGLSYLMHHEAGGVDRAHVLGEELSKRVADDLQNYSRWQPYLHDLGEAEVKHGVRVHVVNLSGDDFGNSALPAKLRDIPQPPVTRAKPNRIGWLIAAILGLAVIAGTSAWLLSRIPKHNAVNVPDKSIAVLPLENLTAEKENAYFADGIQDELLSDLAKIKDLKVISRTSVMQYYRRGNTCLTTRPSNWAATTSSATIHLMPQP